MQEKGQELDLEAKRGSKTKANNKLAGIFAKYNIGKIYLVDMMTKAEQKRTKSQYARSGVHHQMAGAIPKQHHCADIRNLREYGQYKTRCEK